MKAKLPQKFLGDFTLQVTDLDLARPVGNCSIFSYQFAVPNIPRIQFVRKKRRVDIEWKVWQSKDCGGRCSLLRTSGLDVISLSASLRLHPGDSPGSSECRTLNDVQGKKKLLHWWDCLQRPAKSWDLIFAEAYGIPVVTSVLLVNCNKSLLVELTGGWDGAFCSAKPLLEKVNPAVVWNRTKREPQDLEIIP